MTLDEQLLTEARDVRARLLDLQHEVDRARADYGHAIRRLHAAGGSLREIAEVLGLSHQRVHQIVDAGPEDAPARRRRVGRRLPGPFGRFTRYARAAAEQAQAAAAELGHPATGTEHLLLALFAVPGGGAAAALASLGLEHEQVLAAVQQTAATGERHPRRGAPPFTMKAKRALQLAVEAAQSRRDRWIGTEHVLLGLAAEREGRAAELLAAAGADEAAVRAAVERTLAR